MSRRGRPRLSAAPDLVRLSLRLYPGEDDDLIEFFRRLPPGGRATAVKAALRSGGLGASPQAGAEDPGGGEEIILDGLFFG